MNRRLLSMGTCVMGHEVCICACEANDRFAVVLENAEWILHNISMIVPRKGSSVSISQSSLDAIFFPMLAMNAFSPHT